MEMTVEKMEEYFSRVPTGRATLTRHAANKAFPPRGSAAHDPSSLADRVNDYAATRGWTVKVVGSDFEFRKPKAT